MTYMQARVTIAMTYTVKYWFRLAYLHLTWTYFKGQGQGNAYFDSAYLENCHR